MTVSPVASRLPDDSGCGRSAAVAPSAVTISVVICTFDRARLLPRAIASVLEQGKPGDELIVVDDGSTDGTGDLLAAARCRSPLPLRTWRQENRGPSAARNLGAGMAQGSHLVFLDSDDWLLPGALARFRAGVLRHPEAALVFGGRIMTNARHRHAVVPRRLSGDRARDFADYLLDRRPAISAGAAIVERRAFARHRYPEGLRTAEDLVFYARLLALEPAACFPDPQVEKDETSERPRPDPRRLIADLDAAAELVFAGIDAPAALRKAFADETLLRAFRELHRAGWDREAGALYAAALRQCPGRALRLSYLRKALRIVLHLPHPSGARHGPGRDDRLAEADRRGQEPALRL